MKCSGRVRSVEGGGKNRIIYNVYKNVHFITQDTSAVDRVQQPREPSRHDQERCFRRKTKRINATKIQDVHLTRGLSLETGFLGGSSLSFCLESFQNLRPFYLEFFKVPAEGQIKNSRTHGLKNSRTCTRCKSVDV